MPAWMTSLLRDEVSKPMPYSRSSTITSMPARASARATASPTTPAPTTTHSTDSDMARILRDRAPHLKHRGPHFERAADRVLRERRPGRCGERVRTPAVRSGRRAAQPNDAQGRGDALSDDRADDPRLWPPIVASAVTFRRA